MRNVLAALSFVVLFTLGCGQVKSVILSSVTGVRSSDDLVTVQVTLVSNGHIPLEDTDEFCVEARWSQPAVADAGVANRDAGAADDAGVRDAGATDEGTSLVPGAQVDTARGCSTKAKGFVIELKSTRAIPQVAVLDVSITKGFALGRIDERQRLLASP